MTAVPTPTVPRGRTATPVGRRARRRTATLNDLLARRLEHAPDAAVAEVRGAPGDPWRAVTVRELDADVVAVAKGLVARGVGPGDRVGIMSRTRYEWTVLDFAIWAVDAVGVPVYETSSAEQVEWILSDSAVRLLVVETAENAATVASVSDRLPKLEHVLVLDGDAFATLRAEGACVTDRMIEDRRALATPADLATIIYTSGTTGRPKGVELTHGNFTALARSTLAALPEVFQPGSRALLFLPLAHVFARFVQVVAVTGGVVLGHVPDPRGLTDDLRAFRPTFLLAVPRVFEKLYNAAEARAAGRRRLRLFHWATRVAISWSRALDTPAGPGRLLRLRHAVADRLVLSRLRAVLGGAVAYAVSGGSALGDRLGHFYRGLGVEVLEGYGLTESTAPTTVNRPGRARIGTVGTALPGCEVRISPAGEVLLRGPHVFRGYHGDPQATAEALSGGWFRTGDLGALDEDGYLTITGRAKELIVTAGGKNVAPAALEDRVRAHPLVAQCVVVGDDRPFVAALITLDPEGLEGWSVVHGKRAMTVDEATRDVDVLASLDRAVARANRAVSRAESIRRFAVLPVELTVENGYLTPKQTVRRTLVAKELAAEIEELYARGEGAA